MKRLGVVPWRSSLGRLRQGTDVVVVLYRHQPAALLVPVSPPYWKNVDPFLEQVLSIRNKQIQAVDANHPWIQVKIAPLQMTFEEARRGSAYLFGLIAHNVPVILSFYEYASIIMLPLPPNLPNDDLEAIGLEIQTYVLAPQLT